jgi:cytidine deaminase
MNETDDMLTLAQQAQDRAHAPYSGFRVGAVLRGGSGRLYAGCNVENAAYPQSQCAEASALGALVLGGDSRVTEVLVLGPGDRPLPPCGGCRQRLLEFAEADTPVHLYSASGENHTLTLGALMPHAFGPDRLS